MNLQSIGIGREPSAEEDAEAIEYWENVRRREEMQKRQKAFERSMIPRMFRNARLDECDFRIQEWAGTIGTPRCSGIIIRGLPGRGKSYSACAILNSNLVKKRVLFATMGEVLNDIKASYRGGPSERDVIDRYASAQLLCIDDFGKERPTEWMLPIVFELIDRRYRECLPTIITTQYEGAELSKRFTVRDDTDTAKAIGSRLSTFAQVSLGGPDRRQSCTSKR